MKWFAWKVTPASSRRVGGSEGRRGRRRAQRVSEWGARQARSRWTPGDGAGTAAGCPSPGRRAFVLHSRTERGSGCESGSSHLSPWG